MPQEYCFRCNDALVVIHLLEDITFYECQKCERDYARKKGKSLTDRWGSPISIPLYGIIFCTEIVEDSEVKRFAFMFQENYSKKANRIMILRVDSS